MKPNRCPQWITLPVKISRKDFNRYVKPYLSTGSRGPKTKISHYRIFNYILHVLHTGMQWDQLRPHRKEVHWSNVYRWHNKWSKDGSYKNIFETSVKELHMNDKLDLSVLHGDGSNTVAKKGVKELDTQVINTKKA